jgi:hypothetical protein
MDNPAELAALALNYATQIVGLEIEVEGHRDDAKWLREKLGLAADADRFAIAGKLTLMENKKNANVAAALYHREGAIKRLADIAERMTATQADPVKLIALGINLRAEFGEKFARGLEEEIACEEGNIVPSPWALPR